MDASGRQENVQLRRRIARLTEEARKNELAWRLNQQREMQLLEAETLTDLFVCLTEDLRSSCELDAATLLVADPDHEIRHLLIDQGGQPDALAGVMFVDDVARVAPRTAALARAWLGPYEAGEHEGLFAPRARPASVAVMPLKRHGRLIGSLNMGSNEPGRFTPQHATDFLQHLAAIAAYCLENTVNRARLVQSGIRDVLTGWYNRRYLETRLHEEMARSQRDGTPLACLMIDADHFKAVNDTHGHLAGDEVLRQLARCIGDDVRASDVSARFGGEEFTIVLPATDAAVAWGLAERIRAAVAAKRFEVDGVAEPLAMTVSIGVAAHGATPGDDAPAAAEALLAEADRALYEAKAGGRDAVVCRQARGVPA